MKPILFNTEMVKAILEGRKTVTRRVAKGVIEFDKGHYNALKRGEWSGAIPKTTLLKEYAPFKVNDVLYVRETWHKYTKRVGQGEGCHLQEFYGYKASIANSEDANEKWKPSIHMPKEAARLFLRVTDVRVERLQDMTNKDCHKEGINIATDSVTDGETLKKHHDFSLERFATLWDSTIKTDQLKLYGWEANPFVWVIEFEVIDKPVEEG